MDHAGHKTQFYKRLPRGPIWPAQEGDIPSWDPLIAAITRPAADIDTRAEELIAEAIPSTTSEMLTDWEDLVGLPDQFTGDGLTEDQRRAAVLAKLRYLGQVNINDLQETFAALFADDEIVLRHKLHPSFAAGASGSGDGCGDAFQACWTLEYMDNVLSVDPDSFEGWSNVTTDDDYAQSPVSLLQTADRVLLGAYFLDQAMGDVAFTAQEGDSVRACLWVRTESGTKYFQLAIRDRDGSTIAAYREITATPTWAKIEITATIGAGGSDPSLVMFGLVSSTPRFLLSWAMVGVRQPLLEARVSTLDPLNSVPEFCMKGENSTPDVLIDDDGAELFDDEDGELLIDV